MSRSQGVLQLASHYFCNQTRKNNNAQIKLPQYTYLQCYFQTFERVLALNILHGLSPGLCEAISSISRWKLIQAAFPHLLHCLSTLLSLRKRNITHMKFDGNETKLLYTLHWIILDAAAECMDVDTEHKSVISVKSVLPCLYIHPLDSIQLFIYLIAPLVHLMKESEFQTLKLENGLRLWQPMWSYQQPDVPCFSTLVKPQRYVLKAQRNQVNNNYIL